MRRARLPVVLLSILAFGAGCGDDTDRTTGAPGDLSTGATTGMSTQPEGAGETGELDDTYADVADPASLALDADLLDGVAAMSVWEGARLEEDLRLTVAEITVADRPVALSVVSRTGLTARGSAEADLRYWKRYNTVSEGPVEVLDPVVVDGAELARARASTISDLVVDRFFYATEKVSVEIQFLTPAELSEAEREEYIGQVMATLEFE